MKKHRLFATVALTAASAGLLAQPAHAYIDPGTTQIAGSLWVIILPIITAAFAFLGFWIRPVRAFFKSLFSRLLGISAAEPTDGDGETPPGS